MISRRNIPDDMVAGSIFTNSSGDIAKVIKYNRARDVVIEFEDGTQTNVISCNLRNGEFRNRNNPSVYGVGVIGYGRTCYLKGNKHTKEYKLWYAMIDRCYSPRQEKENTGYLGVTVCEEWLSFQNFAVWYEKQPNAYIDGFDLDKDLRKIGSKIYSPETCSLVPTEVNVSRVLHQNSGVLKLSTGKFAVQYGSGKTNKKWIGEYNSEDTARKAYKEAKEAHVKFLANKYKEVLHEEVYKNMIDYKVEDK